MGLWTRNWRVWVFIHLRVGPLLYETGLRNRKWLCQRCLFILYTSMKIDTVMSSSQIFPRISFQVVSIFVVVVVVFHISREDQSWLLLNFDSLISFLEVLETKCSIWIILNFQKPRKILSFHLWCENVCKVATLCLHFLFVQWRGALVWGEI